MTVLNKIHQNHGFTLVEIIISVALLSYVFVAAASYVSTTMRLTRVNQHLLIANRHAENLLEWTQSQKEKDWDAFVNQASGPTSSTYCFNTVLDRNTTWPTPSACNGQYNGIQGLPPEIFDREVVLTTIGTPVTSIHAEVTVKWYESGKFHSTKQTKSFSLYKP